MWIIPKNLESAFVADTAGSIEVLNWPGLNLESSLMWRSKPTLLRTWSQRWKRVYWFRLLCGRILKPSRWKPFEEELTSSLPVILANRSAVPDSEKEQTTQGISGLTLDESTRQYSLDGCFLKMSKDTLRLDSPQSSAIWKKMVTKLRQDCLQRQKSARLTEESGCSSWLTPTANENEQDVDKFIKRMEKYPNGTTMSSLSNQVKAQWRTPAGSDGEGGVKAEPKYENAECPKIKLRDQVHHQKSWPTPTSSDHKGSGPTVMRQDGKDRTNDRLDYATEQGGLPAQESHNTTGKSRGSLNPDWVEMLMGVPPGWTDLGSWATESFHSKRQEHIEY